MNKFEPSRNGSCHQKQTLKNLIKFVENYLSTIQLHECFFNTLYRVYQFKGNDNNDISK